MQDISDNSSQDFELSIFERLTLASMAINKVLEEGNILEKEQILQKFDSINTVLKSVILDVVQAQANDFGDVTTGE